MADVTISYNGESIATMNASGTKTLLTDGKRCVDDIAVVYDKPSAPSVTVEALSVTENDTYTAPSGKAFSPVVVSVPWSLYGPSPVEDLGAIYQEETALKDTDYATWTPSTTTGVVKASAAAASVTLDMADYDYVLLWQFDFTPVYQSGFDGLAAPDRIVEELYSIIGRRPGSKENVQQSSAPLNSFLNETYAFFTGKNSFNGAAFMTNASYGVYALVQNPAFSNTTADNPTLTVYSPKISATCNASYFSTTAAAAIDKDASKIKLRCKLFRTPVGGKLRAVYDSLAGLYNTSFVVT